MVGKLVDSETKELKSIPPILKLKPETSYGDGVPFGDPTSI